MAAPQVFYGSSKRAAGTAELRANLVFNYPVRPADVRPPPARDPGRQARGGARLARPSRMPSWASRSRRT